MCSHSYIQHVPPFQYSIVFTHFSISLNSIISQSLLKLGYSLLDFEIIASFSCFMSFFVFQLNPSRQHWKPVYCMESLSDNNWISEIIQLSSRVFPFQKSSTLFLFSLLNLIWKPICEFTRNEATAMTTLWTFSL